MFLVGPGATARGRSRNRSGSKPADSGSNRARSSPSVQGWQPRCTRAARFRLCTRSITSAPSAPPVAHHAGAAGEVWRSV